jgi:hypothetical protein
MNSPNDSFPNSYTSSYKDHFNDAIIFTKDKKFDLDNESLAETSEVTINNLIEVLALSISGELKKFHDDRVGEIANFGGQCGNVHHALIGIIKEDYPTLCANLTIGDVDTGSANKFTFNQTKCSKWLEGRSPNILDCHVWITIGNNFIIDVTIGTYQNTRSSINVLKDKSAFAYGGIIFGKINDLKYTEIKNVKNSNPANFTKFVYTPVILGTNAFVALAPKFKRG